MDWRDSESGLSIERTDYPNLLCSRNSHISEFPSQGAAHVLQVLKQLAALPTVLCVAFDVCRAGRFKLTIEVSLRSDGFSALHAILSPSYPNSALSKSSRGNPGCRVLPIVASLVARAVLLSQGCAKRANEAPSYFLSVGRPVLSCKSSLTA
jgi:hypothetical protein